MLKTRLFIFFKNLIKYKTLYFETKYFSDFYTKTDSTILSKDIEKNKTISIYGFGPYGEECFVDLFYIAKITAIFDKNYRAYNNRNIEDPEFITSKQFDYIIVTVMNEGARREVLNYLKSKKIPDEKIISVNYIV